MVKSRLFLLACLSILLFLAGIFATDFTKDSESEQERAAEVSRFLTREILLAEEEAKVLLNDPIRASWNQLHYSFFLMDSVRVLAWSKNDFLPDPYLLFTAKRLDLLRVTRGDFIIRKWPTKGRQYLVLVIPLHERFTIENQYLSPQWNNRIFKSAVVLHDLSNETGSQVCIGNGQCIFKVTLDKTASPAPDYWGLSCVSLSIVGLIAVASALLAQLHRRRKYELTFLLIALLLVLLRIGMVEFNFPGVFVSLSLFDPKQFASSSFNASIADLFLNALVIFVLCIYLFRNYERFWIVRKAVRAGKKTKVVIAGLCAFLCFLSFLFPYLFFETIYHNSSIELGITGELEFDAIRITALVSVLVGCLSCVLAGHVSLRILYFFSRGSILKVLLFVGLGSALFIIFSLISERNYLITLIICFFYLFFILAFNGFDKLTRLSFSSFIYILLLIVALAAQGALSIQRFTLESLVQDQFRYGNSFLIDQDVLGEYLMSESAKRIARDPFIQSQLASPFLTKSSIRSRIRQLYINTYFDRYDIQIYLFNSTGTPYGNRTTADFAASIRIYQNDAFKTSYPGIYFIRNPDAASTKQYLVIIPIERGETGAGYVVLEMNLKKVIPKSVLPGLLVDSRFSQYLMNKDFNYAFYDKGKLASSFGEFNFDRDFTVEWLGEPVIYKEGRSANGYFHVAIEDANESVAVISVKEYPIFYLLTNFSFLFILGLGIILIALLFIGANAWIRRHPLNYSARIQLYIYLAFFLPLLSVSLTTLSLISRSANEELYREYQEKATGIGVKLSSSLSEVSRDSLITPGGFESGLIELSKLADADASVYDTEGKLIGSSQPIIYENQFISTLLNREAWERLINGRENSLITRETIGKLSYNCSYAPIKSAATGEVLGVISIPFFDSEKLLENTQINVLSNILVIFVVIFILFFILSFFAVRWLVFPLSLITRTLKKTTLSGRNEPIVWGVRDEMGMLATVYNRMVANLEYSRRELSRSQKESAWREIAKQVAHEIKNPLTPMKLTLQQMEVLLGKNELTSDRTRKSIESLLAQLNILNEIAASFSTFARMPAPELTRIELNQLLKRTIELFANYDSGKVIWNPSTDPVHIMADEQLLTRIFSNIILNALQSAEDDRFLNVHVSLKADAKQAIVMISDNGKGIPPEVLDKIFLPNFTTKKSGSGLGLAVVKQGVEQSGGSIEVESDVNEGTKFSIRFDRA